MNIVRKNHEYLSDIDVLVRVYDNQSEKHTEQEQIACEVLFKPHVGLQHQQVTSWLPRGAVHFVVGVLNQLRDRDLKVQISNELPDNVGVLTSCRENFENAREWDDLITI